MGSNIWLDVRVCPKPYIHTTNETEFDIKLMQTPGQFYTLTKQVYKPWFNVTNDDYLCDINSNVVL